jgi:hypothetical protein
LPLPSSPMCCSFSGYLIAQLETFLYIASQAISLGKSQYATLYSA